MKEDPNAESTLDVSWSQILCGRYRDRFVTGLVKTYRDRAGLTFQLFHPVREQRVSRSKHNPHQGARECARRRPLTPTNSRS